MRSRPCPERVDFFAPAPSRSTFHPPPDGMTLAPGGWFLMGDSYGEAASALPAHLVYTDLLLVDTCEVTNAELAYAYNWANRNGFDLNYPGWL